ncbi:DUF6250 domain-containing protein [Paraburkholderia tropica]|uniref:DUF6250 domain-containing protein n=1 Tax=Paraburkholderia tropica TaxID=92647 RepID=A0AAQ1GJE2_9BURK|nr:DUF6250 domain-containing protein [Paraburkholderia tropica]RQN34992.1 hypothetical protein EHZ25_31660 [Paraburkholderia tropica]SEK03079.1 hypothetical protein SAMN05216550_113257 [Paraburkholderia tropica]
MRRPSFAVRVLPALLALLAAFPLHAAPRAILREDFASFDARRWIVEAEPDSKTVPSTKASIDSHSSRKSPPVYTDHHALVLDSARGLTVWLDRRLTGHYEITYTRTVLDAGGPHDRVSDLNQFWLASARGSNGRVAPFGGSGRFEDYDALDLFYAGIGGNGNTTTRFRRYDGTSARPLLAQYTTPPWLLRANHPYRVRIVVDRRGTRFYLDGKPYFAASPPLPDAGWFGFRSTASRQTIRDFSIRALP